MLSVESTSSTRSMPMSWQDSKSFKPITTGGGDETFATTTNAVADNLKCSNLSEDGYLRVVGQPQQSGNNPSDDLNNSNNQQQSLQNKFAGVCLLAGKYLLFPAAKSGANVGRGSTPKTESTCINIQTKEQYLCKVIPRNTKGLGMLAAYHRLEESSHSINHVIEAILTPKVIYFVMPRHYGNVHSYLLAKRNLEEAEAANIFKQMVDAVEVCHSKGVILRDIKMGRFVFMDKEKTIVKLESLEDATLLMDPSNDSLDDKHGCPNYVSPEKAETLRSNSLKYPGKATDVWCLGVILFTMLVGRYPFNDASSTKLLNKIRAGNFTVPPGMSSSVSSLIKVLLRKVPGERPKCNDILKSPWITRHCITPRELPSDPLTKEATTVIQDIIIPNSSSNVTDQVVPGF